LRLGLVSVHAYAPSGTKVAIEFFVDGPGLNVDFSTLSFQPYQRIILRDPQFDAGWGAQLPKRAAPLTSKSM
jgi:hypothetical protein